MQQPVAPSLAGLERVEANELRAGMYIAHLDRDWKESSFLVQGFYVHAQEDIDKVAQECLYVYVDPRRYKRMGERAHKPRSAKPQAKVVKHSARERLVPAHPVSYEDRVQTREEMPAAAAALDNTLPLLEACVAKNSTHRSFRGRCAGRGGVAASAERIA